MSAASSDAIVRSLLERDDLLCHAAASRIVTQAETLAGLHKGMDRIRDERDRAEREVRDLWRVLEACRRRLAELESSP